MNTQWSDVKIKKKVRGRGEGLEEVTSSHLEVLIITTLKMIQHHDSLIIFSWESTKVKTITLLDEHVADNARRQASKTLAETETCWTVTF